VLRKTLLPRTGYRDGFTRIQQWLVAHLISQTLFDLWDLIVSEIEDTISESFRGRRQLPYAHWITLLILRARPVPLPAHLQRELTDSDTVFPRYDPRQMFVDIWECNKELIHKRTFMLAMITLNSTRRD